jgi:hypothetical protein
VCKIYGEGVMAVKALKDAALNMNEGKFVAVVGPSGQETALFYRLQVPFYRQQVCRSILAIEISRNAHQKS